VQAAGAEGAVVSSMDLRTWEIEPGENHRDHVAEASFFGTSLVSYLVGAGVDTVVVSGCVTSGCVRASVVDAISWGFRTIVPEECVGDRAAGPHTWSLFDMDSKYGDVEPLEDVIASLESTLTALP